MKQKELYKTAIYCRLSLDDGSDGDSSSIHTQKMLLEKYCKDNGYEIYDYYIDDGYSGLNYNRTNFQRMLQDIENGKIELVITKDLSRLGRDYIMTGYYTEIYFNEKGVRYIAVNDNIDTINDNNDILLDMKWLKSSVSRMEKKINEIDDNYKELGITVIMLF